MSQMQIVIGGYGAAGAALALALVHGGLPAGDILIIDKAGGPAAAPSGDARTGDARTLALNAGSRRFLAALNVWPALEGLAHPMHAITITDTGLEEDIRPPILGFDTVPGFDEAAEGEPLAHLVPLLALQDALRAGCEAAGIVRCAAHVSDFTSHPAGIKITLDTGEHLSAALLVAADGARSPIRVRAGISTVGRSYGQVAISATIRHSGRHGGEAVQHFLPAGPFALLPLDEGRSSLVWSERADIAREILADDRAAQLRAISARAAGVRGEILAIEAISGHPLSLGLARRFIGQRLALIADAAHVVHPLAGQGLNLGFEDAAMLAEMIVERAGLGLDRGAPDMLETYQARRRPAAAAMGMACDAINRVFSNDFGPLRTLRDVGLGLVNRVPWLKAGFMRHAAGGGSLAPKLFRE